ncbi:response regulator transcription factor [Ruania alba]|uniref:DNA-binding response regulator, NarL/FixJ family, contains REC and HTH domains n=1 Tax=Ruania alba TaxID=648782 RepID=A0A1H5L7C2_9MICO|nr:response regulator transcription factor [Ruania alba]SEE72976.1 DNA-binding response regulator, NarL/FixJ family, contains REC and HTH domains [Ruania alba]
MISLALVDDSTLVRTGLRTLATHDGDIEVVAEAGTGRAGVAEVRRTRPDVVLMDLRMPEMDGIEATQAICADPELDQVRVLVLTTFDEDAEILAAVRAGASGYLLKDVAPEELREAIRTVAAGERALGSAALRALVQAVSEHRAANPDETTLARLAGLTDREREVLACVGRGQSNDEIATALFVSPATARTYVSRLLAKLDARDRSQLVVLAYETHLVRPGEQ